MAAKRSVWVAKYGDGVVLLCYGVVLAAWMFDLPLVADPIVEQGDERAFALLFLTALGLGAVHHAYAALFIRRHPEVAVENRIRPVLTRMERGLSRWYVRKVMRYDDEAGALRASRHLLFWALVMFAFVALGLAYYG